VVLYGSATWSLTLREEQRLRRVFENRVPRRIFGPKRDEVIGGWRKLHNEELHNLYSSPSIISMIKPRRMRWAGQVARMGRRGMHIEYWWESQKERALEIPRRRWVDNIKMDLREIRWVVWTGLVWLKIGITLRRILGNYFVRGKGGYKWSRSWPVPGIGIVQPSCYDHLQEHERVLL
jgi:hypothetical protein